MTTDTLRHCCSLFSLLLPLAIRPSPAKMAAARAPGARILVRGAGAGAGAGAGEGAGAGAGAALNSPNSAIRPTSS
jgi:hypothetical protein